MCADQSFIENPFGHEEVEETEIAESTVPVIERPPYAYAKRNHILVSGYDEASGKVIVQFCEETPAAAITELRRHLGYPLSLVEMPVQEFETILQTAYESNSGDTMQLVGNLEDEDLDLLSVAQSMPEPEDLLESNDDAPIIKLINAILTEAIKRGTSDIHIEPYESTLVVRFRIDGVLIEVLKPPRVMAPLITSRIKVMSKLDIAEKRLPQDGRIALRIAGRSVDVRVSTMPSGHGERIVMRILDKQAGKFSLADLGMDAANQELIEKIIHKPHGIFLVTGPTGSGKSTTLYACLQMLNSKSRCILTVEDPIEYHIEGIGQSQVNSKVDMTFARGLRAMLRQDPDVVMVGEIRDLETAQIGVQASLTGHMVLSTLHTNSAVGAITRMKDMGLEPFLLASSIVGVLAQRLVRMLCPECKEAYQPDWADCQLLNADEDNPPTIYRPNGCEKCNGSGYKGRAGIYELVAINEELRTMIHDEASEQDIERYARKQTPSIMDEGRARVLDGKTSLEELLRVTREG